MEVTENHFSSTQPLNQLNPSPETAAGGTLATLPWRLQRRLFQPPKGSLALFVRLFRPAFTLALLTPVIAGAILSWWQNGPSAPLNVSLGLVGALCTQLGMNLLHEYFDYRTALGHNDLKFAHRLFATPYHLLMAEVLTGRQVCLIATSLLLGGALAYGVLIYLTGWPVLFFYALSTLLIFTYSAPPLRYGYRSWGIGEVGIFLGYGLLPLLGSYYIQGQTLSLLALWITIPFGMITLLLFAGYNFMHHRRDWLMSKRTFVVTAGPLRALDINALLILILYAAVLCIVSLAHLPVITLLTLAALPLALRPYQLRTEEWGLSEGFQLYAITINAMLWTALLFCLSLWLDKSF